MSDLQIVIPSFGRMPRQATLSYLPPEWCERTTLVINQADYEVSDLYTSQTRGAKLLVHPPEIDTIAKKRAWIIMQPQFKKIVMLDDDLRFSVRSPGEGTKLRQATHADLDEKLRRLGWYLEVLAHAGWSARQGNNNMILDEAACARMTFVLGYRCDIIRRGIEHGSITLGRVRTREDMELTVQLLKLGFSNCVDFTIAADQVAGYAAKGGCSSERSVESSNADAELFAELHPGLVKVVEKTYKGSVNRKEVIVQWKKAYGTSSRQQDNEGTE